MRIGFLFNHAAAHQVAHGLPIAKALPRVSPTAHVELFVTGGPVEAEVLRSVADDDRFKIVRLRGPSRLARAVTCASGNSLPLDRLSILGRNRSLFSNLDALVVPEKTSLALKTWLGLSGLKLVHTRHGAGDRAIGFDAASAKFDFVLMSGPKIRDRLDKSGLLKRDGHAIVGYPKFDLGVGRPTEPLFGNGKPTVLYNPHPSPALSSWYRMGTAVLDWFARQDRFNLIFAPHVMLFAKRWAIGICPPSIARIPPIPAHLHGLPHIHIDPASTASIDMTYTNAADIYLGDASSQVYEFIRRPRPCIFLDPHGHDWQDNPDFAHWQAGPVVGTVASMARALEQANTNPHRHHNVQRNLFAYSFDLNERPSAERAAEAIMGWLTKRPAAGVGC